MRVEGFDFDLTGLRVMPGLINAHDHLEFALFPRLGNGVYRNAGEWARDIYRPDESPVRDQLRVPKRLRLLWGGLRNLLAGVTAVCHHNPYDAVFDAGFPVRVVKECGWAHSLEFAPDLVVRYRAAMEQAQPFVVHLGEGTDQSSAEEIFELDRMGVLGPGTVLVHAVGLQTDGWELAQRRSCSVVWCPRSNFFTLGQTFSVSSVLALKVPLALGTDSALTAEGDLLDEIEFARRVAGCDDTVLARWTGVQAARIFGLTADAGDFIAVREFGAPPELVVVGGRVELVSESLACRPDGWSQLCVEGRPRVSVRLNVPLLMEETRRALGCERIRLAGREVSG